MSKELFEADKAFLYSSIAQEDVNEDCSSQGAARTAKRIVEKMAIYQEDNRLVQLKGQQRIRIALNVLFKSAAAYLVLEHIQYFISFHSTIGLALVHIGAILSEMIHLVFYCQPQLSFSSSNFQSFLYVKEIFSFFFSFFFSVLSAFEWVLHCEIAYEVIIVYFVIVLLNSYTNRLNSAISVESNSRGLPLLLIHEQCLNVLILHQCGYKVNGAFFQLYSFINSIGLNWALLTHYDAEDYFSRGKKRLASTWEALFVVGQLYTMFIVTISRGDTEVALRRRVAACAILMNTLVLLLFSIGLDLIETPFYSELIDNCKWRKQRRIRKRASFCLMAIANVAFIYFLLIKYI